MRQAFSNGMVQKCTNVVKSCRGSHELIYVAKLIDIESMNGPLSVRVYANNHCLQS